MSDVGVLSEMLLGLFSLPDDRKALNLRRERFALVRLLHGISATGRSADIRVPTVLHQRAPQWRSP